MNRFVVILIISCLLPLPAGANPGTSGSSGLITLPSAETVDAGNICLGAWSCYSENRNFSQKSALVLPVSMTLGIGTFWEVYGSYPNLLFNGNEDASGIGTLDIGTKLRFLGDRAAAFKMAADFQVQRHVSENRAIDGISDLSGTLIASYSKGAAGLHVSAGVILPGSQGGVTPERGQKLGVGVDYMLLPRMKLLGEFSAVTNRYYVEDNPANSASTMELSAGLQYYLSPHITLNASAGTGVGGSASELKMIFGISSCQGVGSYVKPIPSVGHRGPVKEKSGGKLNPFKIIPISTLLLKAGAAPPVPASSLEVEVDSEREEVLVKPFGQIMIAPQQASSNLTSPVIPVDVTVLANDEEISLLHRNEQHGEPVQFDYIMSSVSGVTPLYGVDIKGTARKVPSTVAALESEAAKKVRLYRKFSFSDGTYDPGSSTISPAGRKMLSEVAEQIRNDDKWSIIRVDGHTDNIGSLLYNMELSLKRAVALVTYLIGNEGIDNTKVFIKGFGKTAPLADNATAEGRRKNRRTEIQLFTAGKGR